MENILVTVVCNTYNQEDYIVDTIESFLMQKTTFKYVVQIHDDASTDNTTNIIKKYQSRYPDIIIPIYQNENQYSKGINISTAYQYPSAKGKYIALCEGDDYWIDPYKLQKQIDYMENNSDCSVSVHAAMKVNATTKEIINKIRPSLESRFFSVEEVIHGDGDLFATNSMIFRAKYTQTLPDFYLTAPVGDYPLIIYLAICGQVRYIDEFMSSYRVDSKGSWSVRMKNRKRLYLLSKGMVDMFIQLDQYTNGRYQEIISEKMIYFEFSIILFEFRIKDAKKTEFNKLYNSLSIKAKVKLYIGAYFPFLLKRYEIIKEKIRGNR